MTNANGSGWVLGAIGLAVGLLVGVLAAPEGPRPNPQERGIDANLWMQTAGEYRACCLQAYRLAADRLKEKRRTAAKGKPVAVVMDLDETVLDNSGYQTWLYQYGQEFTDKSWDEWEKDHAKEVRLVPGAKDFIEQAEREGVTVVYLSNRTEKNRAGTIAALEHVGLNTKNIDARLLLVTAEPGASNKTARRNKVRERYQVLMLFGDNLRDFDEVFKAKVDGAGVAGQNKGIAERLKKVNEYRSHWGDDWIILPNPSYGEWTKLVGRPPLGNMRPTTMKAP